MTGIVLGGDTAWKVRGVGDLVLAYHWIGEEPAMLIYPKYRALMLTKAVPWAMPLSAAHELVNAGSGGQGVNSKELVAKAERCAKVMGVGVDHQMVMKIADLILSGLDDLIRMPPTPAEFLAAKKRGDGVIKLKREGQIILEKEL